ncbi:MAG: protein kinase [Peptococcaceae bacterium]|nr:protein kinase [Peptococcaceae bacterium]
MADIKQYEPIWGAWHVEFLIGEGAYGKVYKIRREEFGKTYNSALKIMSIPQNRAEIQQMKIEGLSTPDIQNFFRAQVSDIIHEIDLMSQFTGNSHIVSLEDHKVVEHPNEEGWDILIRMELLESLTARAESASIPPGEIIKLGIHICHALELCAGKNIIHRDIKPDNIFVSRYGEYKLGDFGIARQIDRTMSGLSKKGTYTYMAPEVFQGREYGANVDTYGLGIVMYTLLNKNRSPFLPDPPRPIMPRDREEALQRRMNGEPIPDLRGVSPRLNALVLRACAYNRQDRFSSPAKMRGLLEELVALEHEQYSQRMSAMPTDQEGWVVDQAAEVPNPKVGGTLDLWSQHGQDQTLSVGLENGIKTETDAQDTPYEHESPYGNAHPADRRDVALPAPISDPTGHPIPPASPALTPIGCPTPRPADQPVTDQRREPPGENSRNREPRSNPIKRILAALSAFFSALRAAIKGHKKIALVVCASFLLVMVGAVTAFTLTSGAGLGIDPRGDPSSEGDLDLFCDAVFAAAKISSGMIGLCLETEPVPGYGISVDSEIKIILTSIEEAQEVLKELEAHYTNLAESQNYTVSSVEFEEKIEVVETTGLPGEVNKKQEALQVLIDEIIINVLVKGTYEVEEEIAFTTVTRKDVSIDFGVKKIHQEGSKGTKTLSFNYVAKNGALVEAETAVFKETITKAAVEEIILEGDKPSPTNPHSVSGSFLGLYYIQNASTKYVLDTNIDLDTSAAQSNILLLAAPNQRNYLHQFNLRNAGGNAYYINFHKNYGSDYYVDIRTSDGKSIVSRYLAYTTWYIFDIGDGNRVISNSATLVPNQSLVITQRIRDIYSNIVLETYSPNSAIFERQKWNLNPA